MSGFSGRHLCGVGVVAMAVVGCSATLWPSVDAAVTTVFTVVWVSLLVVGAAFAGRWAYGEWSWRQELRGPVLTVAEPAVAQRAEERPALPELARSVA